jgi:hypothetical protein
VLLAPFFRRLTPHRVSPPTADRRPPTADRRPPTAGDPAFGTAGLLFPGGQGEFDAETTLAWVNRAVNR